MKIKTMELKIVIELPDWFGSEHKEALQANFIVSGYVMGRELTFTLREDNIIDLSNRLNDVQSMLRSALARILYKEVEEQKP